jgi:hypothetical protein
MEMMLTANMPHKTHGRNARNRAEIGKMPMSATLDAAWEQQLPD